MTTSPLTTSLDAVHNVLSEIRIDMAREHGEQQRELDTIKIALLISGVSSLVLSFATLLIVLVKL